MNYLERKMNKKTENEENIDYLKDLLEVCLKHKKFALFLAENEIVFHGLKIYPVSKDSLVSLFEAAIECYEKNK